MVFGHVSIVKSPLVRVRSLKSVKSPSTDSYDHLVQTAMKGPPPTPPPYVPEFGDNEITESIDNFDLERIDDRLRTLGIDPDLIDQTDDDVSNISNLSERIDSAMTRTEDC